MSNDNQVDIMRLLLTGELKLKPTKREPIKLLTHEELMELKKWKKNNIKELLYFVFILCCINAGFIGIFYLLTLIIN